MSEQEKLLPCPFCKKPARQWVQGFVRKKLCACSSDECGAYFTRFTLEEWNTRTQPAIEGDVEAHMMETLRQACEVGRSKEIFLTERELSFLAFVAASELQPAIDKAVAEERARCVGEIQEHITRLKASDSMANHTIAGFLGGLIIDIEQGGGDA